VFRPNIDQDIWVFDSSRTRMGRVTSEAQLEGWPVWSADGKRLLLWASDNTARWLGGAGLLVGAIGLGVGAGATIRARKATAKSGGNS